MELRNIKFPLKMANGEESKTIEDLRQKILVVIILI